MVYPDMVVDVSMDGDGWRGKERWNKGRGIKVQQSLSPPDVVSNPFKACATLTMRALRSVESRAGGCWARSGCAGPIKIRAPRDVRLFSVHLL